MMMENEVCKHIFIAFPATSAFIFVTRSYESMMKRHINLCDIIFHLFALSDK